MKDDTQDEIESIPLGGRIYLANCLLTVNAFPLWMPGGMPPAFGNILASDTYANRKNQIRQQQYYIAPGVRRS